MRSLVVVCLGLPVTAWACTFEVAPSGDKSGATDSDEIEEALASGCDVVLTDGEANTKDRYYSSRVVVAEGFSGTISGESRENTIWTWVANDDGFEPFLYDSDYIQVKGVPQAGIWATGLHLEYPGDWAMQDMTLVADEPVDPSQAPGGYFQNVAVFGGNGDNLVDNVGFIATANTTSWVFGPHIMRGSTRGGPNTRTDGRGDTTVSNSYFENLGDATIIMWFKYGKQVVRDNVHVGVAHGVYLQALLDENEVTGNVFMNGGRAVVMWEVPNTLIADNVVAGADADGAWWRTPVLIRNGSTDVTVTGNSFGNARGIDNNGTGVDGAGAVLVRAGADAVDVTIEGNEYGNMDVAIRSYNDGVGVCEPDLTDDQVVGADNACN